MLEKSQPNERLQQEIGILRQRIAELEANIPQPVSPTTYGDVLFEHSGESILIIDPYNMNILDANPNAARRLGYHRAELCQLRIDQIEMPRPLDANDAETSWQSSISGTFFYEGQYRHKNGELIPVEISSRLLVWQGQDVLINFVRDIRWRKEVELALRQVNSTLELQVQERTAELASEKEKLEAVLGSTTEAIAMADSQKRIIYVNTAFVTMTGYSLVEAQANHFDLLVDFSELDVQRQAAAWQEGEIWSGEVKGVRKDGRTYPSILNIVPMFDADGRITGCVTSHQDISHFKALDKAQYSFITNVSHQLRTPLTNIKLYTQLLEGNFDTNKAGHYLEVLGSQAERLEHLVQDILELASLDSSDHVLEKRFIDMKELVVHMGESHQERARKGKISLHCTVNGQIPHVKGDPVRLRQSIGELLDNALAYTPAGGTVTIDTAAPIENNRQWISVTVRDDGPGVSHDEQDRIFERFFRGTLAEQGHISGTGLGLCLTQQIAQAHHGHVTLQSEPGKGAAFTIWLPVDVS